MQPIRCCKEMIICLVYKCNTYSAIGPTSQKLHYCRKQKMEGDFFNLGEVAHLIGHP